ncbi:restriction endonuclease [Streptomyces chartreusis]|uniref:restriction endonuclease n=1 Tax=Streptomyces chartreusis TaxID=1969 RepID=UPI003639A46F
MTQNDAYHWPPELMELLVDTIPLLCRSKVAVLDFLRGAGVSEDLLHGFRRQLQEDPSAVSKYKIVRSVLPRLNEHGDRGLAARRLLLRRVTEFEDFSTCWPDDQLKAKGLVAEVRRVVNIKDSFTRLQQEKDLQRRHDHQERQAAREAKAAQAEARRQSVKALREELNAVIRMSDPQRRGTALEALLNKVFAAEGLSIREAFVLRDEGGQVTEQIDGVVELDGAPYLVEVKYWADALGKGPVAEHLVRVYSRAEVRGLMISASGFTQLAVDECQRVLAQRVVVLGELRELVMLLEQERPLSEWLREKVRRAMVDRVPLAIYGVHF